MVSPRIDNVTTTRITTKRDTKVTEIIPTSKGIFGSWASVGLAHSARN